MEYIYKDIAKFDTQNPIVNDIIKPTQKLDLDTLLSIKDIEIRERLDKLRNGSIIKMRIDHLLKVFYHQLQDLDHLDCHYLLMRMIFLTFHLHHIILIILIHLIYHQLQILHYCLTIANQILRMMIMMMMIMIIIMISILIFLKKIWHQLKNFY